MHSRLLLYWVIISSLLLSGCFIKGRITDENGRGVAGVTVTLSGAASGVSTTNRLGYYQFGSFRDKLPAGSYTVTPSGDTTPDSREVTLTMRPTGNVADPVTKVDFVYSSENVSPRVGCELLEFQSINSIRVWINLDMTLEEFNAIPLPSVDAIKFPLGWFKNQPRVGDGGPDSGRFLRSPGAAVDGEFIVEEHFGHSWMHNATIIQTNMPLDGQGLLRGNMVAKFHEVTFNAERTITVLFSPEGDPYVLIGRDLNRTSDEPSIPDLWQLVEYTAPEQLVILLPEETLNIRADNEDSFQGPVPELSVALE